MELRRRGRGEECTEEKALEAVMCKICTTRWAFGVAVDDCPRELVVHSR